jgi:hypothetical protein
VLDIINVIGLIGGGGQIARVPGAGAGARPNPHVCMKRAMEGTWCIPYAYFELYTLGPA